MSKKRIYMSTVAGFAALLAASNASASTISFRLSDPLGGGETTLGTPGTFGKLTDVDTLVHFAKFNVAGATLNSIDIRLWEDIKTVLTITNNNAGAASVTVNTRISSNLLLPNNVSTSHGTSPAIYFTYSDFAGTGGANPSISNSNTAFFYLPDFGPTVAGGGGTVTSQPSDGLNTTSLLGSPLTYTKLGITNATDLAAFTGAGNQALQFVTVSNTVVAGPSNFVAVQVTNFDLDGQITYNYTDAPVTPPPTGVPEPMTAAVLMAGLAGLAGIRRRR